MDVVKLEKAPRMAVYSPKDKLPWDDAVTLVLKYAEIPFDVIYDEEVLNGALPKYDWLHMHHEDFTGQYSKFYIYHNDQWYIDDKNAQEAMAAKMGFRELVNYDALGINFPANTVTILRQTISKRPEMIENF